MNGSDAGKHSACVFFRSGAGAPRAAAAATPPYAHPISAAATVSGAGPGTSNATAIPRSPPKTPPPTAEAAGGNANAGRAAVTKSITE